MKTIKECFCKQSFRKNIIQQAAKQDDFIIDDKYIVKIGSKNKILKDIYFTKYPNRIHL